MHPLHRIIHLQGILDKFVPLFDALQIIRLSSFESPLIGTIVKAWDPPCLRIPLESTSEANRNLEELIYSSKKSTADTVGVVQLASQRPVMI